MRIALILLVFVISSLVIAKRSVTDEKVLVCSGYDTIETFSKSGRQQGPVVRKGTIVELSFVRKNDSLRHLFDEPEYNVFVRGDLFFPSEEVKRDGDTISAIYAEHFMPIKFRYDLNSNILNAYQETTDCMSRRSTSYIPIDPDTCVKTRSTTFEGVCSEQSRIVK